MTYGRQTLRQILEHIKKIRLMHAYINAGSVYKL